MRDYLKPKEYIVLGIGMAIFFFIYGHVTMGMWANGSN